MDANKKHVRTWLLFAGAGALVVVGLLLHLLPGLTKATQPVPIAVVTPVPTPTPPPVPVVPDTPPAPPTPIAEPTPEPVQPPTPVAEDRPKIDVVFALDTTSSMTGLIEGAKQKIWSIASHIASGRPTPDLRVGLVPYRDRGDAYVTKVFPLTTNLDEVYSRLRTFRAEGGGDPPEDVRQALVDSIRRMNWTPGKHVMRVIFLVGDSPPHDDYGDEPTESAIAAEARRKGIVINTIRCGDLESTGQVWAQIARASSGAYSTINQNGGMLAVKTPMDDRLRELNTRLSETAVYYGADKDRHAAEERAETNRGMAPELQAESARYRALSGYVDSADIVTQVGRGTRVEDLPATALPAPMQAMGQAERRAYIEEKKAERERITHEVMEVSKKRDEYLKSAAPRAAPGAPAAFDDEVKDTVAKQAKSYGIEY